MIAAEQRPRIFRKSQLVLHADGRSVEGFPGFTRRDCGCRFSISASLEAKINRSG